MEVVVISIAAFATAILTFFSGFGLGTILTPVFMVFFPVDLAIGLTAVVHFFNNIFKLILTGKKADKSVVFHFGVPAVIAAIAGSYLLLNISGSEVLFDYEMGGKIYSVYPMKFIISVLLIFFACIDLIPYFGRIQFDKNKLPIGGLLSGFFGGLSGNQGAFRSAFLLKAGLSKESFIATAVVVSTMVDFTRLSVYASRFSQAGLEENLSLVFFATGAGIAGSYVGNKLLKKVTMKFIQILVAVLLILISLALGAGLI